MECEVATEQPRSPLWSPPSSPPGGGPIALSAVTFGDHEVHSHTCHKGKLGEKGCRGGFRRKHYVLRTGVVQIVHRDLLPSSPP